MALIRSRPPDHRRHPASLRVVVRHGEAGVSRERPVLRYGGVVHILQSSDAGRTRWGPGRSGQPPHGKQSRTTMCPLDRGAAEINTSQLESSSVSFGPPSVLPTRETARSRDEGLLSHDPPGPDFGFSKPNPGFSAEGVGFEPTVDPR